MSEQATAQPVESAELWQRSGAVFAGAAAEWSRESATWLEAAKWMFSFPAMVGTFLAGRVFCEARGFFVDPDVWRHIRIGQDILGTHHWPTTGPYSFTAPNMPWMAYEWLGDVILAKVAGFGGNIGMFALLMVCTSAAMLGLYHSGTPRSWNCKAGFVPAGLMCALAFYKARGDTTGRAFGSGPLRCGIVSAGSKREAGGGAGELAGVLTGVCG